MKPITLQPDRCVDSIHIFTLSNRIYMQELSHSDQILKQLKKVKGQTGKKVNVDISMTSPKLIQDVDMAEAGNDMWWPFTGHRMQTWTNYRLTLVKFSGKCSSAMWPRHGQPRGTQSFGE
jgi:hypothetical protein